MQEPSYVAVMRFLPSGEAWALAGRLQAEGIEASVVPQAETMAPYPTTRSTYSVITQERDAARARWILHHVDEPDG